ncbi:hypothetical protein [Streptomyces sp. FIT100]|uniref:hypothetical protein n=1 Tax=Streptomyces sp. FIT100 TaxID=2837956 RepID=UPI0021C72558|nr:hypothetical protein [Streptomyces sp. FIT100]UUN29337.1 hypothetical protein KK483_25360 [Streptomyces sp. FIT100]
MEEAALLMGRAVKGIAGLACAFGEFLAAFAPDGSSRSGKGDKVRQARQARQARQGAERKRGRGLSRGR